MEGVTGSIPVAPTTHSGFLPSFRDLPNMPAIGGLFYAPFLSPGLQAGQVADFGALSPPLKFPFLVPKSCGAKSFAPKLSLPSKRRLTWPNGSIATIYNGTEPDHLRGPQHDAQVCITTTPRPNCLAEGTHERPRDGCHSRVNVRQQRQSLREIPCEHPPQIPGHPPGSAGARRRAARGHRGCVVEAQPYRRAPRADPRSSASQAHRGGHRPERLLRGGFQRVWHYLCRARR
jgi:hypothetical protein